MVFGIPEVPVTILLALHPFKILLITSEKYPFRLAEWSPRKLTFSRFPNPDYIKLHFQARENAF